MNEKEKKTFRVDLKGELILVESIHFLPSSKPETKRNLMTYLPYLVQLSCFFVFKQLFFLALNKLAQICLYSLVKMLNELHIFILSNFVTRDQNECSS